MRPLAFASALLARWDRRVVSPRPLGLVFRRPPAAPVPARPRSDSANPRVQHTHLRNQVTVDLRPRIALTVVRPLPAIAETGRTEAASAGATIERFHSESLVLRNASALAGERALERTRSWARRIEQLVREPAVGTVAAPGAGGGPPPQLVVQRPPPDPTASGEPPPRPGAASITAGTTAAPEALDLSRLTDQVVSAIDDRLASAAERLGRG